VQFDDADVFFAGTLLGLDQSRCPVETDNKTPGDFRIECATMASFFESQNAFNPRNDFVTGRIGGFVEIDNPVTQMLGKRSGERTTTTR
jgi:hypothetical protein